MPPVLLSGMSGCSRARSSGGVKAAVGQASARLCFLLVVGESGFGGRPLAYGGLVTMSNPGRVLVLLCVASLFAGCTGASESKVQPAFGESGQQARQKLRPPVPYRMVLWSRG